MISAGIATYGTWKKAYAVAHATNITSTHAASTTLDPRSGAANRSAKNTASSRPAFSRNGRRGPRGSVERSLIRPAIGFSTTSHAFGRNTMNPAAMAAMPSVSVR